MKHTLRLGALTAAVALLLASLAGCGNDSPNIDNGIGTKYADKDYGFQLEKPAAGEEIAVMHTSMGDISIRFFPEAAPKAVKNFKTHATEGYYDGVTFHRVIQDFMIQGGDPTATGRGGESIWKEKFEDEFDQKLLNLTGALSMANAGVNTNGSQFFINQAQPEDFKENVEAYKAAFEKSKDSLAKAKITNWKQYYSAMARESGVSLDAESIPDKVWELYEQVGGNLTLDGAWRASGGHTVFGQVFDGMDVVVAIGKAKTNSSSKPVEDVTITSIDIVKYEG